MLTCGGDSEDASAIRAALIKRAAEIAEAGIPEADFLRMKRSALGRRIRGLDSFDSTCFRLCAYHFAEFDYFVFPSVYPDVTAAEVCAFLKETVHPSRCALSLLYPKTNPKEVSQ